MRVDSDHYSVESRACVTKPNSESKQYSESQTPRARPARGEENPIMTLTNSTTNSTESAYEEARWSQIFRVVAFSIMTFASLFGNIVMCKAACEFTARKPLSFHMVTNLAVAEIISTLFLPFTFVYQYQHEWPFGAFMCSLAMPLQVAAMFVVTNTLAAIAVYRFIVIVYQPSRRIITNNKMILILFLLWFGTFAVVLPFFMYFKIFVFENKSYCTAEFPGDDILTGQRKSQDSFEIVRFILNFVLPYLIMVVSYGGAAMKLKKHIRHSKEEEALEMAQVGQTIFTCIDQDTDVKSPSMTTQERQEVGNRTNRRRSTRDIVELEYDLLRMIYAVIIIFVLCYLPYQIHFLFINFGGYTRFPEVHPYRRYIVRYAFLLTSVPSALHPLFYGTMNKFYARSFSRLVLCRK